MPTHAFRLLICVALGVLMLTACTEEDPSAGDGAGNGAGAGTGARASAGAEAVDLEQLVVTFSHQIPGRGSEGMSLPTPEESQRFIDGLQAARDGDLDEARELMAPLSYEVREVIDSDTTRHLYAFEEQRDRDGDWPHGWGLYVMAFAPARPLMVEVPHPIFDVHTPEVGVEAFRHGNAEMLMVAGTHRYANDDGSSDVAHEDRTMFARVNRALVTSGHTVFQPHGFDSDSSRAASGEAVVSAGVAPPPPVVGTVTSALRGAGFDVCEYDGDECTDLGATQNVEGVRCREVGADFVHLELARDVRDDPERRALAAAVTVDALAASSSSP